MRQVFYFLISLAILVFVSPSAYARNQVKVIDGDTINI